MICPRLPMAYAFLASATTALLSMPATAQDVTAVLEQREASERSETSAEKAIQAFRDLCFSTFPSNRDFLRGMTGNSYGFVRDKTSRAPWRWDNGSLKLDYITPDMARGTLPAPQCAVIAEIPNDRDHLAIASDINRALLIGDGKSSGRRGLNTTIWTISNAAGEQLRIFFKSNAEGDSRLTIRLNLMKLPKDAAEAP